MTTFSDSVPPVPSTAPVLPSVSQPFISVDAAAYWLHQHERQNDREYGALILQRPDGKFVATTPMQGEATSFDFERLLPFDQQTQTISHPAGYRCVGSYHSHPEYAEQIARTYPSYSEDQVKLYIALPSINDLALTFRHVDFFKHNFVSSPYGSLVAYSINPQNASGNPRFRMGSTPESRIRRIVTIGQLRVLDPGTIWGGHRGPITADWIPYTVSSRTTAVTQ